MYNNILYNYIIPLCGSNYAVWQFIVFLVLL